jgi:hypothetical protein
MHAFIGATYPAARYKFTLLLQETADATEQTNAIIVFSSANRAATHGVPAGQYESY